MKVSELIDVALKKAQEERATRKRSGLWIPSSFGRCYRYQYWNRQNELVTDPIPVQTLRVFKVGSLIHNFVQSHYPREWCEVKVETEDVKGFADIVTEVDVKDIKSVRSYAFKVMNKAGYSLGDDKLGDILQVSWYAMELDKPTGWLIYVNKDDLAIKEFEVRIRDWRDRVVEELSILRGFWNNKQLPPPLPRAYGGKECQYCVFRSKCKEVSNATTNHKT